MTLTKTDVEYYNWLVSQIDVRKEHEYTELFDYMHSAEFVWTVPNDDNRVQDGLNLREEFSHKNGNDSPSTPEFVSILEVLIGVSRRVAFVAGGQAPLWAWRLLKNLGLDKMWDPLSPNQRNKIEACLAALVWRTYRSDGKGGFFPLENPTMDQTKVEIWYQLNAYVNERAAP